MKDEVYNKGFTLGYADGKWDVFKQGYKKGWKEAIQKVKDYLNQQEKKENE